MRWDEYFRKRSIVAFGLLFEFFLNTAFYLGQAFHSVLCLFETVVGTGLGFEQSETFAKFPKIP